MAQQATVRGPIPGRLTPPADPRGLDLAAIGYVQEEYIVAGEATAFEPHGDLGEDGRWAVTPGPIEPFATRIVVRRPDDPDRFDGTVVVEWMNVTVVETAPDWAYTSRTIADAGAAWIGVSAQAIAVEGGTSAIQTTDPRQAGASDGLRGNDPDRYGELRHPGDAFSFDIFSQVAAVVRSPDRLPFPGPAHPRRLLAIGESQSAGFLTTYVNAFHPRDQVVDGFLVHSRGFGAAGLDGTGAREAPFPVAFRDDVDTPVLAFETETDVGPVLGYARARQPDTDHIRVWEVAGTAHADAYLVGPDFALCDHPVNAGPQHYVLNAALEALLRWVDDGTAPPHGPRIETVAERDTTIVRDGHGNAVGGIRTPPLDVPVATLSGDPPDGSDRLCSLFGVTLPFDSATLGELYADREEYLAAFDRSLDAAVVAGFVREADREAFAGEARAADLSF